MDASTSLRLPQAIPQVHRIQKQNGKPKPMTRPPYMQLGCGENHKNQDGQEQK